MGAPPNLLCLFLGLRADYIAVHFWFESGGEWVDWLKLSSCPLLALVAFKGISEEGETLAECLVELGWF